MLTKDLIKILQELIDAHECVKDMMGEHETVIDVFEKSLDQPHTFIYAGFSPDIKIEKSSDGVYDILSAFGTKQ